MKKILQRLQLITRSVVNLVEHLTLHQFEAASRVAGTGFYLFGKRVGVVMTYVGLLMGAVFLLTDSLMGGLSTGMDSLLNGLSTGLVTCTHMLQNGVIQVASVAALPASRARDNSQPPVRVIFGAA